MEFVLLDPPIGGYEPGKILSGEIRYNIAAQQENIIDVRLYLDGNLLVHPTKLRFETYRSNISLIKGTQTLFQGPFTLKQQLLVWPFAFLLPATCLVDDASEPLPPSMDHRFREGVQVRVEYNITAICRTGSSTRTAKQASEAVLVRQSATPTSLERCSHALSFPLAGLQPGNLAQRIRSKFKGSSNTSKSTSNMSQDTLQLDLTLPSVLCSRRRDAIASSLTGSTRGDHSSQDTIFVLEIIEFALRSCLRWQDIFEDVRHIGTTVMRPDAELNVNGQPVILSDALGLQNFTKNRDVTSSLQSCNSVVPQVSLEFTLTVTATLRHKPTGHRTQAKASLPVIVNDSITNASLPPAYERLDVGEDVIPPPYECKASP